MELPKAFTDNGRTVNIVIETPRNSRNKFSYDPASGLYKLNRVLPEGLAFPCDMGFIPRTKGSDGEPLDAMVFMEPVTYPGCLLTCRLIGVLKAVQTKQDGKTIRNDRLLAIPLETKRYRHIVSATDLGKHTINALVHFFEYYNAIDGQVFKLLEIEGEDSAVEVVGKNLQ